MMIGIERVCLTGASGFKAEDPRAGLQRRCDGGLELMTATGLAILKG